MDIIDIVLSKKYTDESLKGITGALAGKNCTIKSATKADGVTTVVFAWTADDGTEKTTTIQVNDGTDDYEDLINRPKIEGVDLIGNKTFEDLGAASATDLAQTDGNLQDLADLVGDKVNLPMPNGTVVDNIEYVDTKADKLKEDISDLKDNVVHELFESNYKKINVSDSEKMSNKIAYIYTDNTVRTYDNPNAYVLHKNVSAGDVYRISSQTHGSENTLLYAICDSDGQVVESQKMNVAPNTYIITNIFIPNNGVDIYLNYFPTTNRPLIVKKIDIYADSVINGSENVCCWGDSLTRGVGVGDSYSKAFPYVLYGLLDGREVINCGVGGENSVAIASRQGALPNIVQPFTIPSDTTATEVTIKNIYGGECGILLQGGSALDPITGEYVMTAQINPCTIDGVEGTLTYTSGKYYFARAKNGSSVTVTRPTVLITSAMKKLRNNISVIWIGTNGGYTTSAELISNIRAMIDYMKPMSKKYIIIGIHYLVSAVKETFTEVEKAMTLAFGRNYINEREYVVNYGLSDANIIPTEADTTAIAQGKIPPSLLYDEVHFNAKGYEIIANIVYKRGVELGYWN